jgi:hypothetical protein
MTRGRRGAALRAPSRVLCPAAAGVVAAGVVAAAVAALAGCGARAASGRSSRDAVVLVRSNVPDASLFLDGKFVAPVGLLKGGVAVSPGRHRVELRHPEFLGRFLELEVAPAERRVVEAELFPMLP